MNYGQLRELADVLVPGAGMGQLMRMFFSGGGGEAPLAEPGTYTLSMEVGGETRTTELVVERVGELTGENSPFAEGEEEALGRRIRRLLQR